jgi:hypothetical protein
MPQWEVSTAEKKLTWPKFGNDLTMSVSTIWYRHVNTKTFRQFIFALMSNSWNWLEQKFRFLKRWFSFWVSILIDTLFFLLRRLIKIKLAKLTFVKWYNLLFFLFRHFYLPHPHLERQTFFRVEANSETSPTKRRRTSIRVQRSGFKCRTQFVQRFFWYFRHFDFTSKLLFWLNNFSQSFC